MQEWAAEEDGATFFDGVGIGVDGAAAGLHFLKILRFCSSKTMGRESSSDWISRRKSPFILLEVATPAFTPDETHVEESGGEEGFCIHRASCAGISIEAYISHRILFPLGCFSKAILEKYT